MQRHLTNVPLRGALLQGRCCSYGESQPGWAAKGSCGCPCVLPAAASNLLATQHQKPGAAAQPPVARAWLAQHKGLQQWPLMCSQVFPYDFEVHFFFFINTLVSCFPKEAQNMFYFPRTPMCPWVGRKHLWR